MLNGGSSMSCKIYSVQVIPDFLLEITYFDGQVRRCDMNILMETFPYIQDRKEILGRLSETVISKSCNSLVLPKKIEIDSKTLWGNAYAVRYADNISPIINFADALIDARERLRISQRDLEEKSGIRQAEISKIERGIGNPSLKTMGKLFEAMGEELVFSDRKTAIGRMRAGEIVGNMSVAGFLDSEKLQGEYNLSDIDMMPENLGVELIDGYIYDMCVPNLAHQLIVNRIVSEFNRYIEDNDGKCIALSGPTGVYIPGDDKNLLVPDVTVTCNRDKLSERGIEGAPDFVLEVLSQSTRSRDLSIKRDIYKKMGVKEYWIVDPLSRHLVVHDWRYGDDIQVSGLDEQVAVGIYEGELIINMKKVCRGISE